MTRRVAIGPPKKTGRPKKHPVATTGADIPSLARQIHALAAKGISRRTLAVSLHVSRDTLARWLNEHDQLAEAWEAGNAQNEIALQSVCMKAALGGDVDAAQWLLRCKHGWRENAAPTGALVAVTFNMPAALPMADFLEMQSHARDAAEPVSATRSITSERG